VRSNLLHRDGTGLLAVDVREAVLQRHRGGDEYLAGLRQDVRVGGERGDSAPVELG